MYQFVYFQYYLFSAFADKYFSSVTFSDPPQAAALLLSFIEFFNIVTLALWFEIPAFTTIPILDMLLLCIILLFTNMVYFFYNKRYKRIEERYENLAHLVQFLYAAFTIVYSISSFFIFYKVNEGYWLYSQL